MIILDFVLFQLGGEESNYGMIEVFSLATAFLSIIATIGLGIFAIWQATQFYKLSQKSNDQIQGAANELKTTVEKLENINNIMNVKLLGMVESTMKTMTKSALQQEVVSDRLLLTY